MILALVIAGIAGINTVNVSTVAQLQSAVRRQGRIGKPLGGLFVQIFGEL